MSKVSYMYFSLDFFLSLSSKKAISNCTDAVAEEEVENEAKVDEGNTLCSEPYSIFNVLH